MQRSSRSNQSYTYSHDLPLLMFLMSSGGGGILGQYIDVL